MSDTTFSFRWGIPWLDQGFTQIPSFFFRRYAQAGITAEEFLFVLHLANYKYESPRGQSSPSLETIAAQMGYSTRTGQRLRAQLEEKAMLIVTPRPGDTNIYSFENMARRLLQLELAANPDVTGDTTVTRGVTPLSPGGVTPLSPEEQGSKQKKQPQQVAVVSSQDAEEEEGKTLLVAEGVRPRVATELAKTCGIQRIKETIQSAHENTAVRTKSAWIVAALNADYVLPPTAAQNHQTDIMQRQIRDCAWHRNPQMQPCPTLITKQPLLSACAKCDLQPHA